MTPLLLAVGTAFQAVGQVMPGNEASRAAKAEQQALQIQEQQQRTAAAQEEVRRREELTAQLGSMQAIRAGRGVGMSSPTGMAILTEVASDGTRDAQQASLNHLLQADASRMAAQSAGRKAKYTLLGGYLGAGADIFQAGYDYRSANRLT